jgi:hemerythrin
VHDEKIDSQHQELFLIANRVMDLYDTGSKEFIPVFQDLLKFLSNHFHTEPMLMKKINYPNLETHIREHDFFVDKIQEFMTNHQANDEQLTSNMLLYLRNWVSTQTLNSDLTYAR